MSCWIGGRDAASSDVLYGRVGGAFVSVVLDGREGGPSNDVFDRSVGGAFESVVSL